MKFKVKEEFKKLIPPLSSEEYKQLETNCIDDGIRDKIIIWDGFIVDGHNRYEIAEKHNLHFQTEEIAFDNEEDVKVWIINLQLGRRNLVEFVKIELLQIRKEILKSLGKEKMKAGAEYTNTAGLSTIDKPVHNTRETLSKELKISSGKLAQAEVVIKKADEKTKEKLRSGEVSINNVYQEIKKEEKIIERNQLIEKQKKDISENKLPELQGLYEIISIDPPWNYGRVYDPATSRVANPYPEMTVNEIKELKLPFTENAILFLWTTHKFLPEAFEIMKEWGFDYKAVLVWNKEKMGMGDWFRMQCEFCLFGIKGKPFWNNTTERDIITESRRQHSRKPDAFFDMVNKICVGRKLEYFAREKRDGWDIFGNDLNKF